MHTAVIGTQWGDEGKGKVVDNLAEKHDIVVRYAGGANAGHTVIVGPQKYVLHLIPCGAPHGKINIIGNGVVINPDRLHEELEMLQGKGITLTPETLKISDRAHVITPWHLLFDVITEMHKAKRQGAIGTTLQGIGPAYELKAGRHGIRITDFVNSTDEEIKNKLLALADLVDIRIAQMGISPTAFVDAINAKETEKMTAGIRPYTDTAWYINPEKTLKALKKHREQIRPFVADTGQYLENAILEQNKKILFEGAQGTLLDLDHGTYPHVTSSSSTIGGIYTGTGIHCNIENRIGVVKAYTTRVGKGAFPTELNDETGERLRTTGDEYGATTGRPRRTGWLDTVILRYSVRVNGINQIALTKLDVLDKEETIKVCIAYEINGRKITNFPANEQELENAKPFYITLPGWKKDTSKIETYDKLPENAKAYIRFIEEQTRTPVKYVSAGARRDQLIIRETKIEQPPLDPDE